MKNTGQKSAAMRADFLHRNASFFSAIKSTRECLCLQRSPEHVLECGHTICDTCFSIFGVPIPGKEYRWKLNTCLICDSQSHIQARLLPPTCGARLLSVDGGGSRCIIPLTYLDALQNEMDLPYPIQEHFDFAIGTSSGSCILPCVALLTLIKVVSLSSPCSRSTGELSDAWSFSSTLRNTFSPLGLTTAPSLRN